MKFSLILCTINRIKEVDEFLTSLVEQTFKDFEVIVVDQNRDNRLDYVINKYKKIIQINHIFSEVGLSIARNKGLLVSRGEIVCFPDDDCIYPKKILENIAFFFVENKYDFIMGKTIDKNTKEIIAGKKVYKSQEISSYIFLGSSTTLFIKNNFKINFDERFGVGAIFNSGEEEDFVFRLLKKSYKGYYAPNINFVYHPPSDENIEDLDRVKQRSIGLGAFIAKHLNTKEGLLYFCKYNMFRPILSTLFYFFKFDFKRGKYYFYGFLGIWKGFIKYFRLNNENFS